MNSHLQLDIMGTIQNRRNGLLTLEFSLVYWNYWLALIVNKEIKKHD